MGMLNLMLFTMVLFTLCCDSMGFDLCIYLLCVSYMGDLQRLGMF